MSKMTGKPLQGRQRGQAGIFMIMSLSVVLATLGLAVDIGTAYYTRQSAQTAADAAAMAAVSFASAGGQPACGSTTICNSTAASCANPPTATATDIDVGCLYAKSNGFVNNGTTQFVSLSANTTAPPGVTGNSPSYWVKADVSATPFTLFGRFGGVSALTINASSTAAVSYYSAGACIYVLDPSANQSFLASGASQTTATCGIFIHSTSTSGFTTTGSASVTASQILINSTAASIGSSSAVTPTPTYGAGSTATSDPLSTLTMPTFTNDTCLPAHDHLVIGSTTHVTMDANTTYCNGISIGNSAEVIFPAGNYVIKDGLSITGSAKVTFGAGTYILNGSSSNIALSFGNSAIVNGAGVTFFITGQYGHTIGAVAMTGATTVNLAGPGAGTYQGMLFLQDRVLSYSTTNTFANSAASVVQGTLYFPTTALSYSGGSSTGSYTAIVCKTIQFTGSAHFKNDPTGAFTGLATTVRGMIN
jgi:hypothetical protein